MALAEPALSAAKWRLQYFYDQAHSSLVINDLQFLSPAHAIAVGYIDQDNGKPKPVSVITTDGGAHWTVTSVKETPVSLFFLNQSLGWMVTPKGIWETADAAHTWRDLKKSPKLLLRVYFLNPQRGFAIGAEKSVYSTNDGGQTWQPIAAAAEPKTDPEHTVYNAITFLNESTGLINGYSAPPRNNVRPDWLDAKSVSARRELPHLSIMLDTRDGGKTWQPSTSSMFGRISKAAFLPDGKGLGLIEFTDNFNWPSEVHLLNGTNGKSTMVYNAKDRAITDLLLLPSGAGYLAGVEVEGRMQHSPIPNKLKVLKSDDLSGWQEMDVDYRANATRAMLRASGDGSLWVATDTGMILKLTP